MIHECAGGCGRRLPASLPRCPDCATGIRRARSTRHVTCWCGVSFTTTVHNRRYCCVQHRPNRGDGPNARSTREKGLAGSWPRIRLRVLERDGWKCAYCGAPARSVDHVIPRARGGTHDLGNLVAACRSCNSRKGSS